MPWLVFPSVAARRVQKMSAAIFREVAHLHTSMEVLVSSKGEGV